MTVSFVSQASGEHGNDMHWNPFVVITVADTVSRDRLNNALAQIDEKEWKLPDTFDGYTSYEYDETKSPDLLKAALINQGVAVVSVQHTEYVWVNS